MFEFVQIQVEDPWRWVGETEDFDRLDWKSIGTGIHTLSISRVTIWGLTQNLTKRVYFLKVLFFWRN